MNLDDIKYWGRGEGLEIVLILVGALLLARTIRSIANRVIMRADLKASTSGPLVASEQGKQKRSLIQLVAWITNVVIAFIAALLVVQKFNLPLSGIVAPATVLGAALGFGSQKVVQDLLAGFFLFVERQYGVGDVIRVSPPGNDEGISGTVEEITLRSTRLRTVNGEVVILPNGEIRQVTNLSRNWAQVVLDIPFASNEDVDEVTRVLNQIGEDIRQDDHWRVRLVNTPSTLGIQGFGADFIKIRFVARTLPGAQWDVSRELRRRILDVFKLNDIDLAEASDKEVI